MQGMFSREALGQGTHFSQIIDEKFKFNRISVSLVLALRDEEHAAATAILPFLLRKGCKGIPDFTALNLRLSELYGAVLDADVSRYGAYQILNLFIRGLDDRFVLGGEPVAKECAELLCALVLDPNLTDNAFPEKDVELERQFLVDTIESEINEKRAYALSQCSKTMYEGTPFAVRKYGSTGAASAITPDAAAKTYRQVMDTAAIEIFFVGSGDARAVREIFAGRFADMQRNSLAVTPVAPPPAHKEVQVKVQPMEVNQGKLVMGLRPDSVLDARTTDAMRMMCALYGGTVFSKLFLNVREKLSLCYYCAARFDRSASAVIVDSGVEFENKEKAQEEILNQLQQMKDGNFTDEELSQTLLALKNSLRSVPDSASELESWYLTKILSGDIRSPEEDVAALETVTRDEVVRAAKTLRLDTVYFLTSAEDAAKK